MYNDEKETLPNKIDVSELAKGYDLEIVMKTPVAPQVQQAIHERERMKLAHELSKEMLIVKSALGIAAIFIIVCIWALFFGSPPGPERITLAAATLTGTASAIIAFLFGRSSVSKKSG